jgi:hypothetical protein
LKRHTALGTPADGRARMEPGMITGGRRWLVNKSAEAISGRWRRARGVAVQRACGIGVAARVFLPLRGIWKRVRACRCCAFFHPRLDRIGMFGIVALWGIEGSFCIPGQVKIAIGIRPNKSLRPGPWPWLPSAPKFIIRSNQHVHGDEIC